MLETEWNYGEEVWFKNNDPIVKRALDKELGRIKYHLIETKGCKPDVKIFWKRRSKDIEVKGNKVACVSDANVLFEKSGLATEIKDLVDAEMKEWKEKRNHD